MNCARLALIALLSLLAMPAFAQDDVQPPDSASDATTPMDKKVGNLAPPTDNTLSNQEVKQLENQGGQQQTTGATTAPGEVSGTTAIYKEKTGSAAKSEPLPADEDQ
jgi:hypothetical protein